METTPYILKDFKPFSLNTSINEVKLFFKETTFSHFPIVRNSQLIGMISETEIEGLENNNETLADFQYLLNLFFVEKHQNILEILEVFSTNQANILAVLDAQEKYLGYYEIIDVLYHFHEVPFLKNEGEILLIEKELKDYSFSEISQIIESNKGTVLGLYVAENNGVTVKIMLKFSAVDVNEIIQSFRRYNYNVLTNHKEDFLLEDLKDRSNYLQKYLDI